MSNILPLFPLLEMFAAHVSFCLFDTEVCCQHCAQSRIVDNIQVLSMDHYEKDKSCPAEFDLRTTTTTTHTLKYISF